MKDNEHITRGSSTFFIPFFCDNPSVFYNTIDMKIWKESQQLKTDYFISYVSNISSNKKYYRTYELCHPVDDQLCISEERVSVKELRLTEIKCSIFGTGFGVIEGKVHYSDIALSEISNFIFCFKRAMADKVKIMHDNEPMKWGELAVELLPNCCDVFFAETVDYKKDCFVYTCLQSDATPDDAKAQMFRLGRGYSTWFEDVLDPGDYDMYYRPYEGQYYSACQEGFVSLDADIDFKDTHYNYIRDTKPALLDKDYKFMCQLLMCQRYSAIRYIQSMTEDYDSDKLRIANGKISELKNLYSFKVVSRDFLYQNLYSKLYGLMGIDYLMTDLADIEATVALRHTENEEKNTAKVNKLLTIISLLSIASVLIDATDYLEYFSPSIPPKWISLGLVIVALVSAISWLYHKKQ